MTEPDAITAHIFDSLMTDWANAGCPSDREVAHGAAISTTTWQRYKHGHLARRDALLRIVEFLDADPNWYAEEWDAIYSPAPPEQLTPDDPRTVAEVEALSEWMRAMPRPWPLVDSTGIAMRAGVHRTTINKWRTNPDFPEPVAHSGGPIWLWPEVRVWLVASGRRSDANWSKDQVRDEPFGARYRPRTARSAP